MDTSQIIAVCLLVYLPVAFFYSMALDFDEPHKWVWWPITLFKFLMVNLVHTLWLALTTGWRP